MRNKNQYLPAGNKILTLCATHDFQKFTRRATIEAVAQKHPNIEALCKIHIKHIKKANTFSRHLKVRKFIYIIPERLKINLLEKVEKKLLWIFWKKYFEQFDIVLFTSPNQYYFLDFIKNNQKIIFLISDPYHLIDDKPDVSILEKTRLIFEKADIVLTTSINLKKKYVPKYVSRNDLKKIFYWPNTVDLKLWNFDKLNKQKEYRSNKILVGFAGNMNEITVDIKLIDIVTREYKNFTFEFAGHLNFKNIKQKSLFEKILAKKNVTYLGYIPYSKINSKVMTWDICLMFDRRNEISEYVHHNKIYQYLALGKPVVAQKTHEDYSEISNVVYLCESHTEYIYAIDKACKKIKDKKFIESCRKLARENASDVRAEQFMTAIQELIETN